MLRRIGKLTVANAGLNVGCYYNHTPYRSTFLGLNLFGRWNLGRSTVKGSVIGILTAWAFGPIVVGRADVTRRNA